MASLQTLELRVAALEARLAEVETVHQLHRAGVKADLRLARVLERLGVEDVTDAEVDAALDAE